MGNSMKKRAYGYELDQYTKVPLTALSDDSDDEDVLYGHKVENGKIELQLVPPQNGLATKIAKPKRKVIKPEPKNKIVFCFVCFILIVCVTVAVIGVLKWTHQPETHHHFNSSIMQLLHNRKRPLLDQQIVTKSNDQKTTTMVPPNNLPGKDWHKTMADFGSESTIKLFDVDNDGKLDILFGGGSADALSSVVQETSLTIRQMCKTRNLPYPCMGNLTALRGTTGEVIWSTYTRSAAIFLNCEDFDVNQDGQKDCIVSGRRATIQAIDTKDGKSLWLGDESFIKQTWNIYQALALPDFDNDGVPEVLITNGGDPQKEAEDHDRQSGRLIILSGATGKVVGTRFLAAPNRKEIYMSPVMYTAKDGSQYILFGSGGETVPGDFFIISMPDLYRYVNNMDQDDVVPSVTGSYNQWQNVIKQGDTNLITVYKGKIKGVMVPPVIVDVNKDGTEDILISVYDGKIILLNGVDLSIIWTAEFPNMESYTSPAPGFFNDDDVLDFMVHWSEGAWPQYKRTQNYILDGRDGSKLLTLNSAEFQMVSDLVLHTTQKNRDLFVMKVRGRDSHIYYDNRHHIHGLKRTDKINTSTDLTKANEKHGLNNLHGGNHGPLGNPGNVHPPMATNVTKSAVQQGTQGGKQRVRRHGEKHQFTNDDIIEDVFKDYSSQHFLCTDDVDIKNEVLVIDRTITNTPIKITETLPEKLNYNVSGDKPGEDVQMCVVVLPDDRTTAAIGDVDGDGIIDIITMAGLMGEKVDSRYSYLTSIYWTHIKKISLGSIIKDKNARVPANIQTKVAKSSGDKDISDIGILPSKQQPWTEYMGSKGNSHYDN